MVTMPRDITSVDMARAAAITIAVDDRDAAAIAETLQPLTTEELYTLVVLLAANVRPDTPLRFDAHRAASTCREAIQRAARLFRVSPTAILGRQQTQHVTNARHVAMQAARVCGLSFSEIGREFRRDHSTVMNGCTRVGELPHLRDAAARIAWDVLGERPETELEDEREYESALEVAG